MERYVNQREHENVKSLLGAYALDAVPAGEMRRLAEHIASCDECAHEVDLLRQASAQLAWLAPAEDPGELVDRITSSLPRRSRRVVTRAAVAVAAVAVIAAGLLGGAFVRERGRNTDLVHVVATAGRTVTLQAQKGFAGRGRVYVAQGRAALVLDHVPDAGRGRAYQLWAIRDAKPVSMVVVDGHGHIERAFRWSGRAEQFAITIEPVGGSPVPTSAPVLAGR
jgi:anti-sigma-K factor RskA